MTDVLFVVTHLFGIGHLKRTAVLARACARLGLSVVVASGGRPLRDLALSGVRLVQLEPALRTRDEHFSELLRADGQAAAARDHDRRRDQLLDLLAETGPRVLVTEMYPFGRRKLQGEFAALVGAARARRPRPWIVASVRDLLVEKPPAKMAWMADAAAPYDRVLVHGDPALLPFGASYPDAAALGERLLYTGYVAEPPVTARGLPEGEVLVSAGGGAFGRMLLMSALLARPMSAAKAHPWRMLVGDNLPEPDFQALRRAAPVGVKMQRARPDFGARLRVCRLSVSQGGYNTVVQLLAAGCPAVVVPYAGGGETEQSQRAAALASRGFLVSAPEGEADPAALARALDRALAPAPDAALGTRFAGSRPGAAARRPRPDAAGLPNLAGAERAAEILAGLAAIVPAA